MAKIEFDLPVYLADFLQIATSAYICYFDNDKSEAASVFIETVLTEYVLSRMSGLISRKLLIELQNEPEKLFQYAARYLHERLVEFEEGQRVNSDWTAPGDLTGFCDAPFL